MYVKIIEYHLVSLPLLLLACLVDKARIAEYFERSSIALTEKEMLMLTYKNTDIHDNIHHILSTYNNLRHRVLT